MNRLAWLSVVSLSLCACERSATKATVDFHRALPEGAPAGAWVVRFADQTVTEAELTRRFAEMNPFARTRFQAIEQRREYVEGLVDYELVAREAIKQGLANDPEVVEAARRVMVQALLKRELDQKGSVTDAQVAKYYAEHQSDFVKPAMVRLAHIAFSKDHRAQAEAVLAQVRALPPLDLAAFGKLAREQSEDERTKVLDGDLRFLSEQELGTQFGPAMTAAAAGLTKVGDVAPELVESPTMLHVVKLEGRQLALDLSLEQARPSITQVLLNDSRQARYRALIERLKREANVEVNESSLTALTVDVKAPALEAKGPQPGFLQPPGSGLNDR
jgi:peptidyl-prolyl cis-trans isomerase C